MDRIAITSPPPRNEDESVIPSDKEACVECRSRKRKCVRSDRNGKICDRCTAQGSLCVFSRAKPGRKRNRQSPEEPVAHKFVALSSSSATNDHATSPLEVRSEATSRLTAWVPRSVNSDQLSSLSPEDVRPYAKSRSDRPSSKASPLAYHPAHTPYPYIASEGFSLRGVLNEATRNTAHTSWTDGAASHMTFHKSPLNELDANRSLAGSLASPGESARRSAVQLPRMDLVSTGAISAQTAVELFRFFFDYMNPIIAILDERLHGYPHINDRSNLLSSAIIAVSAKVCRPELHPRALDAATHLMSLAFERNVCNVEFVQALGVMVFWRSADDDSGWRKTGFAIRMAYELGLHRIRRDPLPPDPHESLELLNRERTWIHESLQLRLRIYI